MHSDPIADTLALLKDGCLDTSHSLGGLSSKNLAIGMFYRNSLYNAQHACNERMPDNIGLGEP